MPTRRTVLSYLEDYASRGSSIVFAQRRGLRTIRCSYKRLLNEARRFARELEARHIQQGDRVLLCGDNSLEWVTAFWGCCLRGAVVVPLDKGSSPEFVVRRWSSPFVAGDTPPAIRSRAPALLHSAETPSSPPRHTYEPKVEDDPN